MLKKALLLSFVLLVFPFFLKGEEEWQVIEPPQSYAYLLERIQENLPIINFDTEEHRNIYNDELQVTINLALQGDLEKVKERINEIHIPQANDWITDKIHKENVVVLLKLELFGVEEEGPLFVPTNFSQELKRYFEEGELHPYNSIIHHATCSQKTYPGGIIHFAGCSKQIAF